MSEVSPRHLTTLKALAGASGPLPAGTLAERAGYQGKTGSSYGGAARAPMYWGRLMKGMPSHLVWRSWVGASQRFEITDAGRDVLRTAVPHG